jgi:Ku70/Ku80 beta-barrel domain
VAPRAYWKGYLKLSLVSCPVALFPASTEREKITFNQINKKTGNRIRYRKVDAETGDEFESPDIIKGYEVGKGQYTRSGGLSLPLASTSSHSNRAARAFSELRCATLTRCAKRKNISTISRTKRFRRIYAGAGLTYRRDQVRPLRA